MLIHRNDIPIDDCGEQMVAVRFSALGDVALVTGTLDYWRRKHGLCFQMITKAEYVPLFINHPAVCEVIGLDRSELHGRRELAVIGELTERFIDCKLVDLHCSLRSRLLRLAWKNRSFAYKKMSFERRMFLKSGGRFFEGKLKACSVPQRFVTALTAYLGVKIPQNLEVSPVFFLEQAELQSLQTDFPELPEKFVALHPFASSPAKNWPWKSWTDLAARLVAMGITPVWLGVGQALDLPKDGINLLNKTDLRRTIVLLKRANLLISGDSGPVLLARGVGTPVLSLEGPTCPGRDFYPPHMDDLVLNSRMPCSPCSLHGKVRSCKFKYACMTEITVDMVEAAAMKIWLSGC